MRANVDLHERFKVMYFSHALCKNKIHFQIANVFLNLEVSQFTKIRCLFCIHLRLPAGVSPGCLPEGESLAPSENEALSMP